ncbi:hypothetical protein HY636_00690 [Candidatus Woesearchaeota archaeon]|nr:hypothetical protein [Candidatus Woesearchaeota archaeon]
MVDIIQKLPYGVDDGPTKKYIQIKCKSCSMVNDVETWIMECFTEMDCNFCRAPLKLENIRGK